ncbi:MAG TPA: branched-chain amino acid ABC transporter permease [Amycolatopsis sp.]|nr:branched-chain amino acid ABC transporter permease [Amycolatopsis sp.]
MLNSIVIPAIVTGALYTLVALGLNVLVKVTGVVNFAHGDLLAWAPLAVLVATTKLHLPLAAALIVAAAFVILLALIEERIAIRPFLNSTVALPWILSTLAVSLVLTQLSTSPFSGNTVAFPYSFGQSALNIGPIQTNGVGVTVVATAIVLYVAVQVGWRRTHLGKMLEAVSDDSAGAAAIGISARRASQIAAVVAAIVAFGTGIVSAPQLQVSPGLGLTLLFSGFLAAAMGGIGSFAGALPGGILVGFITQLISVYLSPTWINVFLFLALLGIYLVRPHGLFGQPVVRAV